jgi:hypothetical protein
MIDPQYQQNQPLQQISDTYQPAMQAHTSQNLRAATTGQGQVSPPLHELVGRDQVKKTVPTFEANPKEYLAAVTKRIGDLRDQAKMAEKSGNIQTARYLNQVAGTLVDHVRIKQNELAHQAGGTGPTSQPAASQPTPGAQ